MTSHKPLLRCPLHSQTQRWGRRSEPSRRHRSPKGTLLEDPHTQADRPISKATSHASSQMLLLTSHAIGQASGLGSSEMPQDFIWKWHEFIPHPPPQKNKQGKSRRKAASCNTICRLMAPTDWLSVKNAPFGLKWSCWATKRGWGLSSLSRNSYKIPRKSRENYFLCLCFCYVLFWFVLLYL